MIYILLTIACTLAFGIVFKVAAIHSLDGLGLVTINYAVALLAVILRIRYQGPLEFELEGNLILLGCATGILFIGGFLLLAVATRVAGMSLALSAMRVSVVIPFTYSWIVWGEVPNSLQRIGMVLACLSVLMITWQKKKVDPNSSSASKNVEEKGRRPQLVAISLLVLFLSGGLTDVSMKTFNEVFLQTQSSWQFMMLVFGTATTLGLVAMLTTGKFSRTVLTGRLVILGLVLGLVNVGSVEFLLQAIDQIDGTVVFPVVNIAVVAGGAIIGIAVWHEQVSRMNLAGIAVAALSLLLLQL